MMTTAAMLRILELAGEQRMVAFGAEIELPSEFTSTGTRSLSGPDSLYRPTGSCAAVLLFLSSTAPPRRSSELSSFADFAAFSLCLFPFRGNGQ